MSTPYIGEIRMFGGSFAINGWSFCDGTLIPIDQNSTLFQLIGTTYGGDGLTDFALPNLQSRVPIHMGQGAGLSNYVIGQAAGVENVTLTTQQIPAHSHVPQGNSNPGSQGTPASGAWAANSTLSPYATVAPTLAMDPGAIGSTGGSQPHDNIMPYLAINFIISLFGVFPSPN